MNSLLQYIAPLIIALACVSCKSPGDIRRNSGISSISVGSFKTTNGMKPWTTGSIKFNKVSDKSVAVDQTFAANKDNTDSKIDLKIPKGMYTLNLAYFGTDATGKPLYKNCLDDKGLDVLYGINKDVENLHVEICDGDNKIIGDIAGSSSDVSIVPEVKKSASGQPIASELLGSWTQCSPSPASMGGTSPLKYEATTLTFDSSGQGKSLSLGFKDAECKTAVTQAEVDAYVTAKPTDPIEFVQHVKDSVKGYGFNYKYGSVAASVAGSGTLDLLTEIKTMSAMFQNYKIVGSQLLLSIVCDAEGIKAKTCSVIAGNRADNRSAEFGKIPYIKKTN